MSMSLSTDMDRLTREVRAAVDARHAAVQAMRDDVRSTLAASAATRTALARNYRAEARKHLTALAKDVSTQHRATAAQVKRLRSARRRAGSQMRSGLRRDVDAIMKQAQGLRAETAGIMRSLAAAHAEMAERQKAALGEIRSKLRTGISGLLGDLRIDRIMANTMWSRIRTDEAEAARQAPPRRAAKSEPRGAERPSSRNRRKSNGGARPGRPPQPGESAGAGVPREDEPS